MGGPDNLKDTVARAGQAFTESNWDSHSFAIVIQNPYW